MSAPVSVVIPTLNAVPRIGPTLGCLVAGAADGLIREVILADGGSGDAIADVADHAGARLIETEAGRGLQLRAGAEAASGPWLLILHADTVLTGDWMAAVRRHIERHPGRAGYFTLRFDSERRYARFVEGWVRWRCALFALPFGDQGLLIPRDLYEQAGGYADIPLMEDVALVRRLGRGRLRPLGTEALTSPDKYEREGYWRRGWRNWGCLTLYFLGVSTERIARIYRR